MSKMILAAFALMALAGAPVGASAAPPTPSEVQAIEAQRTILLDAHLAGMKAGLKLDETQAKLWPAFEGAIRAAAKARSDRWRETRERMASGERPSPIERLGLMADHLNKSAAELRVVADQGQPLFTSLTATQKLAFGPLMHDFKPISSH